MATLRRYGHDQVVEAAAVVTTKLIRTVTKNSKAGKGATAELRDIARVGMIVEASKYLPAHEIKDFLTYLSLL